MNQDELKSIIAKDIGVENLSQEDQNEIISRLGGIITQRIVLEIIKRLPEENRNEYEEIGISGDEQKMQEFLGKYIPDAKNFIHDVIKKEIEDFKNTKNDISS